MAYKPAERNRAGIQFADLRASLDAKYDALHDELSACYYAGRPFRSYGVLDKATFDQLHGLVFLKRDVEFHAANLAQPPGKRVAEERYNDAGDGKRRDQEAAARIAVLRAQGIDLEV